MELIKNLKGIISMAVINDIGIIMVTYNPDLKDFQKNIFRLIDLKRRILIVDNGSNAKCVTYLKRLSIIQDNIDCIFLRQNKGIGFAQNIGINFFKSKGVNYLFFLDQDSYIDLSNLEKLKEILISLNNKNEKIIMIGPAQDYDNLSKSIEETSLLISSGSLVLKNAFDKIGNFKEEFFIDYIDYEWVWRAQRQGYKVFKTNKVKMQHQTKGVPRLHGHTIDPIFRLYYIYRNSMYLILYEKIGVKEKTRLFIRNLGKLIFQINLPQSNKRIKVCFRGIYDGARKKLNI